MLPLTAENVLGQQLSQLQALDSCRLPVVTSPAVFCVVLVMYALLWWGQAAFFAFSREHFLRAHVD